jgi:hypothetical protein
MPPLREGLSPPLLSPNPDFRGCRRRCAGNDRVSAGLEEAIQRSKGPIQTPQEKESASAAPATESSSDIPNSLGIISGLLDRTGPQKPTIENEPKGRVSIFTRGLREPTAGAVRDQGRARADQEIAEVVEDEHPVVQSQKSRSIQVREGLGASRSSQRAYL